MEDLVEPLEIVAGDRQLLAGPVQPLADGRHDPVGFALLVGPLTAAGSAVTAGPASQWADQRAAAPLAGPQVCFLVRMSCHVTKCTKPEGQVRPRAPRADGGRNGTRGDLRPVESVGVGQCGAGMARRSFLAASGGVGLLVFAAPAALGALISTAPGLGQPGRFLTAHELDTLRA